MSMSVKDHLQAYLQRGREALLWKLDGLVEYDLRRPMVATGTNLLGLVKHVASTEAQYFGLVFDRPFGEPMPWMDDDAEPNSDLYATQDESPESIVAFYRRVWTHADATIAALPLDAPGRVPWWPDDRRAVTLGQIMVHMNTETDRHTGHADIVRELIDGSAGARRDFSNLQDEPNGWSSYRDRLERIARAASP